ncbi:MAG: hypothetical protein AAGJ79_00190 [Verrucomicrobiota bacterium]
MNPKLTPVIALIASHLLALYVGSAMQYHSGRSNSHAHLSDVGDAVLLGEYFSAAEAPDEDTTKAGLATSGIIYRILTASTPGPNSKVKLERSLADLRTKYGHASPSS